MNWQKQPPEVFYKKSCSQIFQNIHMKTPVLGSLFHKIEDLQACTFIKKRLQHRCFSVAKFLQNIFFQEHLRTATFHDILLYIFIFSSVKWTDMLTLMGVGKSFWRSPLWEYSIPYVAILFWYEKYLLLWKTQYM